MATYQIDPAHSEINFKVKHLMITNVTGNFKQFNASMKAEAADFSDAQVSFEADVNSISTNNEQRDAHLRSDDFFNAEQFPKLTFVSTNLKVTDNGKYALTGNLTIRNITKPVTLDVEFGGVMVDPWGQHKAGFEISGVINRKDYDLKWSATTEAGGLVVSDEVRIQVAAQMIKQG